MSRGPMGLALLAGVVMLAGVFWIATGPLEVRRVAALAELSTLEAEAAGLRARVAEFRAAGEAGALSATMMLPGATRAEAAVGLQERIVDLAGAHGVVLSAFAEGAAPDGLSQAAAAVVVEGEGTLEDVTRFLAALEGQSPPVAMTQLMVQPRTGGGVSVRLVAWGFVQGEAG
ncbi:MAG: Type secretion system protein subtype b [Pseudomonadota bacterium]|jgi:hypothetical protein